MHRISVIEDHADLLSALELQRGSLIRLSIPNLDPLRARIAERELNKSLGECGCRLSAAFLVVSLAAILIWDFVTWGNTSRHLIASLTWGMGLIVFFASTGRALGILSARSKFQRSLTSLIAELRP
jgi:hypothetical protein